MFWSSLLLSTLMVPACLAAPSHQKRAAIQDATLYAYGANISGFPVLYQNGGDLYVASSNSSTLEPITWDIASMSTANVTTMPGTLVNGTSAGDFWIDAVNNFFDKVTVVGPNSTVTGTTGMSRYGTQLVYLNNASSIESNFWAQEISTEGGDIVWALHWNTDNEARTGAVPVVLKTAAPASKKA